MSDKANEHGSPFYTSLEHMYEKMDQLAKLHQEEVERARCQNVQMISTFIRRSTGNNNEIAPKEEDPFVFHESEELPEVKLSWDDGANASILTEVHARVSSAPFMGMEVGDITLNGDIVDGATGGIDCKRDPASTRLLSRKESMLARSSAASSRKMSGEGIIHDRNSAASQFGEDSRRYASYASSKVDDGENAWVSGGVRKFLQFQMRQPWSDRLVQERYGDVSLQDIVREEKNGEDINTRKSFARKPPRTEKESYWFMIHPEAKFRAVWVLICVLFLIYDFVMVPFTVCFDPQDILWSDIFNFISIVFWTLDIPLNFITGVQKYDYVEMQLNQVARTYTRSWLAFDICLVLPEWLTVILADEDFYGDQVSFLRAARWGRIVRLLRLARILRVARLKSVVRRLVYAFHLSKIYVRITQGWVSTSLMFVVFLHIISCFWYAVGNAFDNGWVQVNGLASADIGRVYIVSVRWNLNRLHGLMSHNYVETDWEMLVDSLLTYCSLVLISFYIGKATAVVMTGVTNKTANLWKISVAYVQRHKIASATSFRLERVLEAAHLHGAGEVAEEESMLLEALPVALQDDLLYEARTRFLVSGRFFKDLSLFNRRAVRHICTEAITQELVVEDEVVFAYADACNRMLFIHNGAFSYIVGRGDHLEEPDVTRQLQNGGSISEPALWTTWEHMGLLYAQEESGLLCVNSNKFAQVILQHKGPCMHAVRYAKHFVWKLNHCSTPNDLTQFSDLSIDNLDHTLFDGTEEDHFMFISHYKVEAGTEATLMRDLLGPIINADLSHPANHLCSPIFIDSEDLSDLARLKEHVMRSVTIVLLLTPGLLSRPWCLFEIVTAIRNGVGIVPVEVQRPGSLYRYPDEEFYAGVLAGKLVSQQGIDLLSREGIKLAEVESAIRQVFQKISLPFSPHKTKSIREAELNDILKRCNGELAGSKVFARLQANTGDSGR